MASNTRTRPLAEAMEQQTIGQILNEVPDILVSDAAREDS